jgi:hypothetical protein
VTSDTLETWDTHGLLPGTYILKMTLSNSLGDSIEPTKGIYLGYAGLAGGPAAPARRLAPTVCRGVLVLDERAATLVAADGRRVAELRHGSNDLGALAPGVYFLHQASGIRRDASGVTRLVLVR